MKPASNRSCQLPTKIFFFTLIILLSFSGNSFGQDTTVVISKDIESISIKPRFASFLQRDFDVEAGYKSNLEQKKIITPMPPAVVSKKILFRFKVANNDDQTDSLYFFPGFSFSQVILYKIENDKAKPLPIIAPKMKDSISYRLFYVLPHDTVSLLAECYPLKTYTNVFRPKLINPIFIRAFALKLPEEKKAVTLFTYVFSGLLLMMVLFSLANFLQAGSKEFLYYTGYAFFLGLMLFTKQYYYNRSYHRNFFFESYLDFILQCLGIWFFMFFMIRFLETKKTFPFLHKLYVFSIFFLPVVMAVYTFMHYGPVDYYWENMLENYITKDVLLVMMVIFLVYALKNWKYKLLRFLFWGNLLYLVFALFSQIIVLNRNIIKLSGILDDSLVLYELGLLIELMFFLMGLIYKNRMQLIEQTKERERLKMENERKELEKQMAVMQAHQEERERISADIHDELGSGMTTIRLMSEIAKNKLKENVPVEVEKISSSANEVLNKMNAIIWSMNSSNDSLDSLISYIRAYAIEYFDGTQIDCRVMMPEAIPDKEISGDKRRNVFLCVKETLNNALKHSKADKVNIDIKANENLNITITDNGVGIDPEKIRRFGNGLKNIEKRMKRIGGTYQISNHGGTRTTLELSL